MSHTPVEQGGHKLPGSGYANTRGLGVNDCGDVVGTVFNDPRYGSTAAFRPSGDRAQPVLLDVPPSTSTTTAPFC
ncbi:hypothetical protein P3102_06020 [Amycolatopsis sp. QT-25]|uniref:hypothetical protein n=1 Tax=Amycolatopsis sp. QT-25 TaxID=3034022 RepID=UPI0023ECB39A|nr:hypothetical protein [Amycolatopsis sp. QT-25]WET80791.1 hypothetical protein P3102_06020 [Amycolatopsis sp. QT-25]